VYLTATANCGVFRPRPGSRLAAVQAAREGEALYSARVIASKAAAVSIPLDGLCPLRLHRHTRPVHSALFHRLDYSNVDPSDSSS